MKTHDSLKEFFEKSLIPKQWLAKNLDMQPGYFYQICSGKFPLPEKYWDKIIELTAGHVSIANLIEDALNLPASFKVEMVGKKCVISLEKTSED